jgi:hypothetical protein
VWLKTAGLTFDRNVGRPISPAYYAVSRDHRALAGAPVPIAPVSASIPYKQGIFTGNFAKGETIRIGMP